jgi:hypothetical protein
MAEEFVWERMDGEFHDRCRIPIVHFSTMLPDHFRQEQFRRRAVITQIPVDAVVISTYALSNKALVNVVGLRGNEKLFL